MRDMTAMAQNKTLDAVYFCYYDYNAIHAKIKIHRKVIINHHKSDFDNFCAI
jgi:hypothetical protein